MTEFNFKKHLCILLGIILLVANTQIFSQEENALANIVSPQEIEELSILARNVRAKYNESLKNITGTSSIIDHANFGNFTTSQKNPYIIENIISNSYKKYYEQINELANHVQIFQSTMRKTYGKYIEALPEGTYLKKVTANYINNRMNTLFNAQNQYLEKLLSLSDIIAEHPEIEDLAPVIKNVYFHSPEAKAKYLRDQYARDSRIRNLFIKDLAENQTYYHRAFSEDIEALIKQLQMAKESFSMETIEFFSGKTHTAEEVLRYLETRLPENQKAVLFALKVSDEGTTIKQLIPHIRYYLKQTNRRLWKLDRFSAKHLSITLSKMSLEQRINFIDDLLDFSPETKLLRNEIQQAEKTVGKKIVSRSGIRLSGTFMAIGAFLIASTITEVTADNNFYKSIGPGQLAQIKHKINDGEMLSLQEMAAYYTDERNAAEIAENPMGLLEAFEIAITINDCLDALNVEKSPHNPAAQERRVNKAMTAYLNKINLENADLGLCII